MGILVVINPDTAQLSWNEFLKISPPYSIALDGYVAEAPRFDPSGPRANFNHHEGVDRLATRATCAQILIAIRQGLFETFRENSEPKAIAYVNDCDEDVCCSCFLLKNHRLAENALNPALNKLISVADLLDTTAGSYRLPAELEIIQSLAWIFEPYRRARKSGELERRDASTFSNVITDVENRIFSFLCGKGESIPLDTRYKKIGGGAGWAMISEIGVHGRTGAFIDGIRAYVIARQRQDSRWSYTIGRQSQFIPFDVPRLITKLTEAEELPAFAWGGGNTIGGSSRSAGSRLLPQEVEKIINENLSS